MSVAVTLAELADVAFRTARGCGVNAGALQLLLRGLLEHLRLQNAATHLSEDERGLLQPEVSARPPILLHPGHPGGSLGVTELPSSGQGPGMLAADTEQMVQLRKRIEVIEEGMTKVRSHPQHPAPCSAVPVLCRVHVPRDVSSDRTGEPGIAQGRISSSGDGSLAMRFH